MVKPRNVEKMTSLSDQLKSSKSAGSRVIFLSLKEEIMAAIEDGWTIKDAWDQLNKGGKFPFTYALFVRHFNRYCREKETIKKPPTPITTPPPKEAPRPELPPPKSEPDRLIVVGKTRKNPFVDPDPLTGDEDLI